MNNRRFIGVMTGNSMDAVDAVLVEFNASRKCDILDHAQEIIPATLAKEMRTLAEATTISVDQLLHTENAITHLCAQAISQLSLGDIPVIAIGCHGQTIAHRPSLATTWQLLNGALLAELTKTSVVCDFRRRDMASGGEGAPFAPLFHRFYFADYAPCYIVNIGGIANITYIDDSGNTRGWDIGPGMMLMDAWQQQLGKRFDFNGEFAQSGTINKTLLDQLLSHPFFSRQPPKSCGREEFALHHFNDVTTGLMAEDVQATFLELTALLIAKTVITNSRVFICGGGGNNLFLIKRLKTLLSVPITLTDEIGLPKELVEATTFAWLAKNHVEQKALETPSVTGGQKRIAGAFYP